MVCPTRYHDDPARKLPSLAGTPAEKPYEFQPNQLLECDPSSSDPLLQRGPTKDPLKSSSAYGVNQLGAPVVCYCQRPADPCSPCGHLPRTFLMNIKPCQSARIDIALGRGHPRSCSQNRRVASLESGLGWRFSNRT